MAMPTQVPRTAGTTAVASFARNSCPSLIGAASSGSIVLRSFSPTKLSAATVLVRATGVTQKSGIISALRTTRITASWSRRSR